MSFMSEFRDFAMRGNVVDLAVGVVIGGAFGKIVGALVDKVMMPPLGWVLGGIDFADKKVVLQTAVMEADKVVKPEVAVGYGEFINAAIQFVIVAWALFLVIKAMNRLKKKAAEAPAAPPPTPEDVALLREIRDLLKRQ
ncbi:MAG: large-conductance mechanosensitive channel protein MscL [Xanthomonadales bacterium]|nr:Large-conductance mechanosensitive channel [Xanthomonadales bacterium]MCC6592015.1 large-conductance mechanosensitive channel protein MscL [Xanthomonadales bacterium]MCE7931409.1 large-conductance mechanosensitive channel protein MscL [Xanthomonadales bacterium PRO6]